MNWTYVYTGPNDIQPEAKEFIFALVPFSRLPLFSKEEGRELAFNYLQRGFKTILEWDILMTENDFLEVISHLDKHFLEAFSSVRVQDLGAYEFLLKNFPEVQLQLILEHGNHNLESLQAFSKTSSRLERMILSPQIPIHLIREYAKSLACPVEILFEGPLLLSYTPRKLLTRLGEKEVLVKNIETQTPNLRAIENKNGTFVFHSSRLSLKNHLQELSDMNECFFRIDKRANHWVSETIDGFYENNESTEVFVHLKNAHIEREDGAYAGEVIDVLKERYIGISFVHPKRELKIGDILIFKTPEGRIKEQAVTSLCNFLLEPLETVKNGDVVFVPHKGVVSVRSSVYFK